jgi:hypothetical protein
LVTRVGERVADLSEARAAGTQRQHDANNLGLLGFVNEFGFIDALSYAVSPPMYPPRAALINFPACIRPRTKARSYCPMAPIICRISTFRDVHRLRGPQHDLRSSPPHH